MTRTQAKIYVVGGGVAVAGNPDNHDHGRGDSSVAGVTFVKPRQKPGTGCQMFGMGQAGINC